MAQTKLTLLTIVVLFLLSTATTTAVAKKHKECDFKTITEDESCKSDWKDLKPVLRATQNMLGYAWVQYKIDKHMGSQDDAQDELDEKVVPVCKGPGDLFYVLDHHHLLAALDASDYPKARPTMHVVCDLSDSKTTQEFWSTMEKKGTAYFFGRPAGEPNALPGPISYEKFPLEITFNKSGTPFQDSPWRSMAGYVRKIRDDNCEVKYCQRGYDKVCDKYGRSIPYFEFRWTYFFNYAYLHPADYWISTDFDNFKSLYEKLPASVPTKVDEDPWLAAAQAILPLARSDAAADYSVPKTMGLSAGPLPGTVAPGVALDHEDADCAMPVCGDY